VCVPKCLCLGVLRRKAGYYLVSNTLHSGTLVQETGNNIIYVTIVMLCFHFVNHIVETSCLNQYVRLLLLVLKTAHTNFRRSVTLSHIKQDIIVTV
jgi:hypothetical protein